MMSELSAPSQLGDTFEYTASNAYASAKSTTRSILAKSKVLRAARAPFLLIKPAACVQFAALRVDQYVLPRLHTRTRQQVKSSKSASSDAVPLCGDAHSKNGNTAVSTFCENWLLPSF